MHVSVLLPVAPADLRAPRLLAELVRDGSAHRFWMGHSFGVDSLQVFAGLAGAGLAVPCGMAVGLVPLQTSTQTALQARSVAALTGHPFVHGLGVGNPDFARAVTGRAWERPSAATVRHLREVRGLLAGDPGRAGGAVSLPPLAAPPVELGAGVLRSRHTRRVAAAADVAISLLAPPAYLRDRLIPAWRDGRAAAGENTSGGAVGGSGRVVSIVHVAPTEHLPAQGLAQAVMPAVEAHTRLPHYQALLRAAGVAQDGDTAEERLTQLDEAGVVLTGPEREIASRLRVYAALGIDEVVLDGIAVLAGSGMRTMVTALDRLATLVAAG